MKITKKSILNIKADIKVIFRNISSQKPENYLRKDMIDKYPEILNSYIALGTSLSRDKAGWIGMISLYPSNGTTICQVFAQTQSKYRRRSIYSAKTDFVRYEALDTALKSLRLHINEFPSSIAFEEGFGLSTGSNGNPDKIKELIIKHFGDIDTPVTLCTAPVVFKEYPEKIGDWIEDFRSECSYDDDGVILTLKPGRVALGGYEMEY